MIDDKYFRPAETKTDAYRLSDELYGRMCLHALYLTRNYGTVMRLQQNGGYLISCIDHAHVFGKGSNCHMKNIPANIIPLNRFSHSMIDQSIDPVILKLMGSGGREKFFTEMVGEEIYKKLEEIRRAYYGT